ALRGDARRTLVRVTAHRLDAPDRQQRLAADVQQVATERKCDERGVRKAELARADKHHTLVKTAIGKHTLDAAEADLERQPNVIAEYERPGARATFAAVDRDEVDAPARRVHEPGQVAPEGDFSDSGFDADWKPGRGRNGLDEVEQRIRITK